MFLQEEEEEEEEEKATGKQHVQRREGHGRKKGKMK